MRKQKVDGRREGRGIAIFRGNSQQRYRSTGCVQARESRRQPANMQGAAARSGSPWASVPHSGQHASPLPAAFFPRRDCNVGDGKTDLCEHVITAKHVASHPLSPPFPAATLPRMMTCSSLSYIYGHKRLLKTCLEKNERKNLAHETFHYLYNVRNKLRFSSIVNQSRLEFLLIFLRTFDARQKIQISE